MLRSIGLTRRRIRQTLTFANGPRLLFGLATARTPWRRATLEFRTASGLRIQCPNVPGARIPIYEIFVEDAYRVADLLRDLPDQPIVLDIGGQVGCFALALAEAAPAATVHTFEASPSSADWLLRNVMTNHLGERIHVHAVALHDHTGTLDLIDNGQASALNGGARKGAGRSVRCVTFADAIETAGGHVDLVKIDTEGAEFSIILGSHIEDWRAIRRVVVEYHDVAGHDWEELRLFFEAAGLHVTRQETAHHRHGTAWLDRNRTHVSTPQLAGAAVPRGEADPSIRHPLDGPGHAGSQQSPA